MRKWFEAARCGLVVAPLLTLAACDSGGKSPHRPADASVRDATQHGDHAPSVYSDLSKGDPAELFDQGQIRTFELRLDEQDLAFLDDDPKAEEYVGGELLFEGKRVGPVGIRYKGSTGSFVGCLSGGYFPPTGSKSCPKLSMKIKIDYADSEAKFYGQKKLLFHAMNSDRSLMRERLGYGAFRAMGVNASRTAHMRLLINGVFNGLYLLVEEIDGRFTRSRFEDGGEGNLYKEVWPVHRDPQRYLDALESNRDEDAKADKIQAFARDLADADDTSLPGVLEAWLDTDYMARLVAVDRIIHHDDGPYHWYCQSSMNRLNPWQRQRRVGPDFCGNHNYYWYEDTTRDRLWMIPWDFDGSMAPRAAGFTNILTRWDDTTVACDKTMPAVLVSQLPATCDPLQRGIALGLRQRVYAAMQELINGPLSEETVSEQLDAWADQIEGVVEEANAMFPREPNVATFRNEIEALKTGLVRRRAEVLPLPLDAGVPDGATADAEIPDADTDAEPPEAQDAGASDAATDAGAMDAAQDAGARDASSADAQRDASATDAGLGGGDADAHQHEASPTDAAADVLSPEASAIEAGHSDAETPDAETPNGDLPDT